MDYIDQTILVNSIVDKLVRTEAERLGAAGTARVLDAIEAETDFEAEVALRNALQMFGIVMALQQRIRGGQYAIGRL